MENLVGISRSSHIELSVIGVVHCIYLFGWVKSRRLLKGGGATGATICGGNSFLKGYHKRHNDKYPSFEKRKHYTNSNGIFGFPRTQDPGEPLDKSCPQPSIS